MNSSELHRWDVSPEEAIEIQNSLRSQLDLQSESKLAAGGMEECLEL